MLDRETTLRDLENLGAWHTHHYTQFHYEAAETIHNALTLLRGQEPVKPKFDSLDGNVGRWRCGNCQVSLGAVRPPYCWHCGRAVKWNEG